MNSSKKILGGKITGACSGFREGLGFEKTLGLEESSGTRRLLGGFLWQVGGIMTEQRTEATKKSKDLAFQTSWLNC